MFKPISKHNITKKSIEILQKKKKTFNYDK
jgi:hypothetical protein